MEIDEWVDKIFHSIEPKHDDMSTRITKCDIDGTRDSLKLLIWMNRVKVSSLITLAGSITCVKLSTPKWHQRELIEFRIAHPMIMSSNKV